MKKLPQHLEESLSGYLDGTLPPDQHKAFELRLLQDPALQKRLEELQAAERLLPP
jgi:anti-sigma factor RsiW